MKTKYIEIIDLVLTNPANQLSKSSRDMLETMKNGLRLDIMKNELKIEKEDHSEEMLSLLEELISYEDRCRAKNEPAIGNGWYNKAKQLINKVKDNGK